VFGRLCHGFSLNERFLRVFSNCLFTKAISLWRTKFLQCTGKAYWRIARVPKPYRCLVPGAIPYVGETRLLHLDGREVYQQSLEAWHPRANRYVPIVAPMESHLDSLGTYKDERQATAEDRAKMVFVASCIEDTYHRWQVRVSEVTSVWLSTDGDGIKALASLRDDPRTASGRRAPLLHWVREHLRRTPGHNDVTEVRRHLRGITQFRLGTVQLEIREPRKPAPGSSPGGAAPAQ
jgi:hypothetical protein